MASSASAASAASAAAISGVGIGLRAQHYEALLQTGRVTDWLEVHAENYFGAGGPPLAYLMRLREDYAVSVHGVGLSLGSVDPLNREHLRRLRDLNAQVEPGLVSEHLCWGSFGGEYFNDLLPLPYTEEALDHVAARVREAQDFLGRQLLVENVSSYLRYAYSPIAEWDFLNALVERAGCALLLDINNIFVSACNHGFDARDFLAAVDFDAVREIHLAGFAVNEIDGRRILIDHHGDRVDADVWALYEHCCLPLAHVPVLVEWDTDIPELSVLLAEADKARAIRAPAVGAAARSPGAADVIPA